MNQFIEVEMPCDTTGVQLYMNGEDVLITSPSHLNLHHFGVEKSNFYAEVATKSNKVGLITWDAFLTPDGKYTFDVAKPVWLPLVDNVMEG